MRNIYRTGLYGLILGLGLLVISAGSFAGGRGGYHDHRYHGGWKRDHRRYRGPRYHRYHRNRRHWHRDHRRYRYSRPHYRHLPRWKRRYLRRRYWHRHGKYNHSYPRYRYYPRYYYNSYDNGTIYLHGRDFSIGFGI